MNGKTDEVIALRFHFLDCLAQFKERDTPYQSRRMKPVARFVGEIVHSV